MGFRAPKHLAMADIRVRLGGRPVLRGLSLDLGPGRLALVSGPNGSGKTTLLRTAAGRLRPLGGSLFWFGEKDLKSRPDLRSALGYVGHAPQFYEDLGPLEHLEFHGALYGVPGYESKAQTWLKDAGLSEPHDVPVRYLSQGQRARLRLARAFFHRPLMAILDEPSSGLDRQGQVWLKDLLKRHLKGRGSALLATHQPSQFKGLGASHRVLKQGRWSRAA